MTVIIDQTAGVGVQGVSVHCALCTVHCTLYSVHCTLYSVHCTGRRCTEWRCTPDSVS